jgi:hypothetical protein
LAQARVRAHAAFDPKWQSGLMTRSEAYTWLALQLGVPRAECHMLRFDIETCNKVIALCVVDDFDVV